MDVNILVICVVFYGIGIWFTLAVFNNIFDFQTNKLLIGRVMSMCDIKEDPVLGNRLQWRSIENPSWHRSVLMGVILYQLAVVCKMLITGYMVIEVMLTGGSISADLQNDINLALGMLLVLWFGFLIGGLWFGYWIKMQQIQTSHILLTILTLFSIVTINVLMAN